MFKKRNNSSFNLRGKKTEQIHDNRSDKFKKCVSAVCFYGFFFLLGVVTKLLLMKQK